MNDDEFIPSGRYWTWPIWQRALALATLRPAYLLAGVLAMARQWLALRYPNKPFRPLAWVHAIPCQARWCGGHDEVHAGPDGCLDEYIPHSVAYERNLDTVRALADGFDFRVGRTYLARLKR